MPSDTFIAEMKGLLEQEKSQLESQLGALAHTEHGDLVATPPEYERNEEANADEVADLTVRNATTEAAEGRLKEVKGALERITAGTYGVTADGDEIPEPRLRANPAATTIVKKED